MIPKLLIRIACTLSCIFLFSGLWAFPADTVILQGRIMRTGMYPGNDYLSQLLAMTGGEMIYMRFNLNSKIVNDTLHIHYNSWMDQEWIYELIVPVSELIKEPKEK
ncbi:MAG: hypothetical protein JW801_13825 [Bacteroidales bacterium]|nr:hypothetical protein [Bacteroidales bacterium]